MPLIQLLRRYAYESAIIWAIITIWIYAVLRGVLRRSNSEDCACLSPRLLLPADWCKQAAAASGTGKEQGEPMEGEKRGLPAVEMKKDAAFIARVPVYIVP